MDAGLPKRKKVQIDEGHLAKEKFNDSDSILTNPYSMASRAAVFKEKYKEQVGYSFQAKQTSAIQLGINTSDVRQAIGCLGFENVDEDMAEHLVPDDEKLSLLMLTLTGSPDLCGTSYLMMKPVSSLMSTLCNKWHLVLTLRQTEARMLQGNSSFLTGSGNPFSHDFFMPFSLSMGDEKLESILEMRPGAYLAKPVLRSFNGPRPQIVSIRAAHELKDLLAFLSGSQFRSMDCSQVILQEYIHRPLLVDKRKFELRVYLLVANPKRAVSGSADRPWQCGHFVFYHPGFARLCAAPYDPGHAADQRAPPPIQGDVGNQLVEATTWYPDELNAYLNRKNRVPQRDWVKATLYPQIGAALGYLASVFRSCLDDHDVPTSTFCILGADFLVDEDLRLRLVELDEFPCWRRRTSVLEEVLPSLWREAACLTSEICIRYKIRRTICDECLVSRQNFRMVYSSEDPSLARRNVTLMYD